MNQQQNSEIGTIDSQNPFLLMDYYDGIVVQVVQNKYISLNIKE